MSSGKEIQSKLHLRDFSKADKIIRFLLNTNDDSIELTETEKEKFELLKKVHGYRSQYHRKTEIVAIMKRIHKIQERQCYNLINECEYVFGSVNGVNKDYERNFLLENSVKNIEIAMASRSSIAISKALAMHYKISGLEEFIPDMPDFSQLEQHKYIISLPPQVLSIMMGMVKGGVLNVADFIPPEKLNTAGIQEAKEINEQDGTSTS